MPSLGRGLSSLIPTKNNIMPKSQTGNRGITEVSPGDIIPNPNQPREFFNNAELQELVVSIKEYGILQPLLVSEIGGGKYELIAGERRLRAAKIAGLAAVPVVLKSPKAQEKLELALVENLHRENLNPIEEAKAYKNLSGEFNLTHEDIARKMGKSRSQITNTLRLLNLPENIKTAIIEKTIPPSAARLLVSLTPKEQELFLEKFLKDGMTVRDVARERQVRGTLPPKRKDANILAVEEDLREALGKKVNVKKRGVKGNITIEFYSDEEFKELVEQLKSVE